MLLLLLLWLLLSRLWHQLTLKLSEASRTPYFVDSPHFYDLYRSFIADLHSKLNPLSYAIFTIQAASQLNSNDESLAFLSKADQSLPPSDPQSKLMLMMEMTRYKLKAGSIEDSKQQIDKGQKMLDNYSGIMAAPVYSIYYRAKCELALIEQQHTDYYQNALLFLTYTPLDRLTEQEKRNWAIEIGIAALVGKSIYNFGELLQHAVLNSLNNSNDRWLCSFLSSFNEGDIEAFTRLLIDAVQHEPRLADHLPFLQQKIRVMCLIDLVFKRPANQRVFTFIELSRACQVEEKQIEWLLMKALALKVIKGRIDQINKEVRISWVQARVLNENQIATLKERLETWSKQVEAASLYIEQNAAQIVSLMPS